MAKTVEQLTIEETIDSLFTVRKKMKELSDLEKELKNKILEDGRETISTKKHTMKIQTKVRETFNEEAFIEAFQKDKNFDDSLKAKVLETKMCINEVQLNEACKDELIPVSYLEQFNTVKESKAVMVK